MVIQQVSKVGTDASADGTSSVVMRNTAPPVISPAKVTKPIFAVSFIPIGVGTLSKKLSNCVTGGFDNLSLYCAPSYNITDLVPLKPTRTENVQGFAIQDRSKIDIRGHSDVL
jgi:hypothetical protein